MKTLYKIQKSLQYSSPFKKKSVDVKLCEESFWLTQVEISKLFGCDVREIHRTLKALFNSNELKENEVNKNLDFFTQDGNQYSANFYNLDAIIAVGYRINTKEATHFHIWSTQMLKSYFMESFQVNNRHSLIASIKRRFTSILAVA